MPTSRNTWSGWQSLAQQDSATRSILAKGNQLSNVAQEKYSSEVLWTHWCEQAFMVWYYFVIYWCEWWRENSNIPRLCVHIVLCESFANNVNATVENPEMSPFPIHQTCLVCQCAAMVLNAILVDVFPKFMEWLLCKQFGLQSIKWMWWLR